MCSYSIHIIYDCPSMQITNVCAKCAEVVASDRNLLLCPHLLQLGVFLLLFFQVFFSGWNKYI